MERGRVRLTLKRKGTESSGRPGLTGGLAAKMSAPSLEDQGEWRRPCADGGATEELGRERLCIARAPWAGRSHGR